MTMTASNLRACRCCGLVHRVAAVEPGEDARCTRCSSVIRHGVHPRAISRTAALSLAALLIYPVALVLPVMTIERFGHEHAASIWAGMIGLLAEGHWGVGIAVLVFSIVAPIAKLVMLFVLCAGERVLARGQRAWVYHAVEFIGRWGMVDVLLVAVLVAAAKLGDLVEVTPGFGVIAFGSVVVLSMLASMSFDPRAIWEDRA